MNSFIEWLEKLNASDTRVRAILRRSLAFRPGTYFWAAPYVEPFLKNEENQRRREIYYLVAGLWALHWREDRDDILVSIGSACGALDRENRKKMSVSDPSKLTSTERRFINFLDADHDQLPHRLRQMVSLLKNQPIDFGEMLKRLMYWDDDLKRSQNAWARDFYRTLNNEKNIEMETSE
ncbi:MAG: type I-E CRISPR-associated protein Cse2/CasB [Gammaproteobacteria bacterium]|nr:type I-E CRISPR-associated protein Cse2/CasB [Gammaproteobacteria bacterium]MCF6259845.1 type I-E CRISPR-associated protein Cse2/CasB [Gammaproteobacteria bacterium]